MAKLQITLVRSLIGRNENQRATVTYAWSSQNSSIGCPQRQPGYPRHGQPVLATW